MAFVARKWVNNPCTSTHFICHYIAFFPRTSTPELFTRMPLSLYDQRNKAIVHTLFGLCYSVQPSFALAKSSGHWSKIDGSFLLVPNEQRYLCWSEICRIEISLACKRITQDCNVDSYVGGRAHNRRDRLQCIHSAYTCMNG